MGRRISIACAVAAALTTARPATQQLAPGYVDPAPVLQAAAKAIGTAQLQCVTIAGTGYAGAVGQQRESGWNMDWPRIDSLANYTRTMNWDAGTMREEFDRKPGLAPASWKYGVGWVDGPRSKSPRQIHMVSGSHAWHMDGVGAQPVASDPDLAEIYQLEMWLNPHGFLKAAMKPGANPKAVWRWELGEMGRDGPETVPEKVTVVSITVLGKYRVDATVNKENMLQRIHTWVPDPVLGDMNYEHEFTNDSYIDIGNGIRFPTGWHSHHGWDDNFGGQTVTAGHNGFGGTFKDIRANTCGDPVVVPDSVRQADTTVRVATTRLADGVYLLGGGTHNSVAVEFRDFVAVIEAPLNERRSLAVIEEVVKLFPDKPIRFVVNTHQHFDHAGGLRTYMHIGATIVTQVKNFEFYNRDVLTYAPRTLRPDMVSLWPPTELSEGYQYERVTQNYVISDGARNLNMYYVQPLAHAEGMLMAYLPAERMLIEADLFDTHEPTPAAPTPANTTFYRNVQMLKLNVAQIVPIHGNPVPWTEFLKVTGVAKAN
ncbi:MAG TPA: MBL fold metallo-hydrolase [Vicinamibacterales bacterium]|nr:MBL fold metallo-hydrolase [Vicinamibacterales bacterium]